jgi:hypothetical protein
VSEVKSALVPSPVLILDRSAIVPLKSVVHSSTALFKKIFQIGLSILDPNFSEIALLVEILVTKWKLSNSCLQAIDELVYSWCMKTLAIVESQEPSFHSNLSFWELAGVGSWQFQFGHPKSSIVPSIVCIYSCASFFWKFSLKAEWENLSRREVLSEQ